MAVRALPDSKTKTAERLGLSRSALYYQPRLPFKDQLLKSDIERVIMRHRAYGHRRIAMELGINKKRVLRIMKLFNLKVLRRRKKPKKPKDLNQEPAVIPNLLWQRAVGAPNVIWASDFTYLPYFGKFTYLATVEDVFTRKIVGWAMSSRHNTELVALALIDAAISNPLPEAIHSDQGSEYRDKRYLNLLKSLNIQPSMSAKSSPWQNGYQESFYAGFKLELGHPEIYDNLGELVEAVAGQIYYYNHLRIHSALKCPPEIFNLRISNNKLRKKEITLRQNV